MTLNEMKNLPVRCGTGLRQIRQRVQHDIPLTQIAERQLADDKRVSLNHPRAEPGGDRVVTRPKMIDPNGRIGSITPRLALALGAPSGQARSHPDAPGAERSCAR